MKLDAFSYPVTKDEAKAFMEAHPVRRTFFNPSKDIVAGSVLLFSIGLLVLYVMRDMGVAGLIFTIIVVTCMAIVIPAYFYFHQVYALKNAEIGLKIERFARDNGWIYTHRTTQAKPATALFSYGKEHEFINVVTASDFEIGQMQFTTGSGRSEQTYRYGYMILPLERTLPHMLLDGLSNNMSILGMNFSNISTFFDKNQIDLLEGDFNKYFKLYAPDGYGVDVRYIFTPDLMNILVQESDSLDIEILDNNLYVYFGKHDLQNPQFWQKAERLKNALQDKLTSKVLRYEDANTSDGTVALEAKRLKKRVPVVIVIFAAIVIVANTWELIISLINFVRGV